MALPAEPGGWVLFHAESRLGPWLRRSAAAHTLLAGTGFAVLLLVALAEVLRASLPARAFAPAAGLLVAIALASALPLPLLAHRHDHRRVLALDVDPTALTLHTRAGPRTLPLGRLASVRPVAEPAFVRGRPAARHGPLAGLPGFHAGLVFAAVDGARWEFHAADSDAVAGVLAWLDVLGEGDKVHREPSALAAQHTARDRMALAQGLVMAGIGVLGLALAAQLAPRFGWLTPSAALAAQLGAVGVACALYVASFRVQLAAAEEWLEARGLRAGPPASAVAPETPAPVAR